jgi:hypothetical protein
MYYLRFTNTAQQDLERATSIHSSDLSTKDYTKQQAAKIFGCDVDMVGIFNDHYCHILDGICGYMLQSETLEEAIEEVQDRTWQFQEIGQAVIYSGRYSNDGELVPDGDLFVPWTIEATL